MPADAPGPHGCDRRTTLDHGGSFICVGTVYTNLHLIARLAVGQAQGTGDRGRGVLLDCGQKE